METEQLMPSGGQKGVKRSLCINDRGKKGCDEVARLMELLSGSGVRAVSDERTRSHFLVQADGAHVMAGILAVDLVRAGKTDIS